MKSLLRWCALLPALFIFATMCEAQVRAEQIDSILQSCATKETPGLAVGVIHDGKLVFAQGYGLSNLEKHTPITPTTNFRLASVTKQFTAMAVMLLVHDGKLHYEDSLSKVLPEFPAYGQSITIRNLLNHTSGLKDYGELYLQEVGPQTPPEKVPQLLDKDVLRLLERQSATSFAPGAKWEYSNSGYAVLAMVVERVSGKRFEDFLQERIFRPLRMKNTVAFVNGHNEVPNRAFGYRKSDGGQFVFADQSPTSAVLGDGGIYTSIKDIAKWDQALRTNKLLSESEMQAAYVPVQVEGGRKLPDGSTSGYGFGWFLDSYHGHERLWHDGGTIGFLTMIQRFPKERTTVVVLSNRIDLDPQALALKVADLYLK